MLDKIETMVSLSESTSRAQADILSAAVFKKDCPEIDRLLTAGHSASSLSSKNQSALHIAATFDDVTVLSHLLNGLPDTETQNAQGYTPLHMAVITGRKLAVDALLGALADHTALTRDGESIFTLAYNHHPTMFTFLTTEFNLPGVSDAKGNTPLHFAVKMGARPAVNDLIAQGYDPLQENKAGETPLSLAVASENKELELALRQNVNATLGLPGDKTIKEILEAREQSAIAKGRLQWFDLQASTLLSVPEAHLYGTFFDIDEDAAITLDKTMLLEKEELAFDSPILRPIKTLVGLAKIGVRLDPSTDKRFEMGKAVPFRSFGASSPNVSRFIPYPAKNARNWGQYNLGDTAYFAAKDLPVERIWSTKGHEEAHFAMIEVFHNACNPYTAYDVETKRKYQKIVSTADQRSKVLADSAELPTDSFLQYYKKAGEEQLPLPAEALDAALDNHIECTQTIRRVFELYPKDEWDRELIVRVPEIMEYLGNEKGDAWLKAYMPDLLRFYMNHINTSIGQHLTLLQEHKHVDNSRILDNQIRRLDQKIVQLHMEKLITIEDLTQDKKEALAIEVLRLAPEREPELRQLGFDTSQLKQSHSFTEQEKSRSAIQDQTPKL